MGTGNFRSIVRSGSVLSGGKEGFESCEMDIAELFAFVTFHFDFVLLLFVQQKILFDDG